MTTGYHGFLEPLTRIELDVQTRYADALEMEGWEVLEICGTEWVS